MTIWPDVIAAIAAHGLLPRGMFHPGPEDHGPDGSATILLVGNAGPQLWSFFSRAMPEGANPLDEWCKSVLNGIARRFGAVALFPSDGPPYLPFQRWAMKAEAVFPSPLGMLIHPDYGLWHGYRGALAFAEKLPVPPIAERRSPCDDCTGRPCLSACPVAAIGNGGYDVHVCATHLRSEAGGDCMARGCRARRACPIGRSYVYEPAQAAFHMRAFLAARS